MTGQTGTDETSEAAPTDSGDKPPVIKYRRRRRWPWVVLIPLVILVPGAIDPGPPGAEASTNS